MNTNWQKTHSDFESIKQGSPSSFWSYGLQRRLDLAQKYVNFKDKKILDAGCGIGMFMEQFSKLTSDVYGFEYDPRKVEIARKKFKHVEVAGAEDIPFEDNTFDIIWFHEVLEHVNDDKKSIQELIRVLKPGGKMILFTPNRAWPFETHGIFWKGKYKFGNIPMVTWLPNKLYKPLIPHVRNYTNKDLMILFKGLPVKVTLHKHVFPGFDGLMNRSKLLAKATRTLTKIFESTPLQHFGISHFFIVEKV